MPPRRDPSEDGVLNPLSPGLAVLDARLPLLALALRALGILLLGARLAGVLTAHLATLHLFHGGHHVRVLGGLVRSSIPAHLLSEGDERPPKEGALRWRGGRTGRIARQMVAERRQQRFAPSVILTFILNNTFKFRLSISLATTSGRPSALGRLGRPRGGGLRLEARTRPGCPVLPSFRAARPIWHLFRTLWRRACCAR